MTKHNNMIPNGHFHKKWQGYVKMWFSQPARKIKRRKIREQKAIGKAPCPKNGPLRPAVQCQSFRYNSKCRLGRGFSLQELQAVKLNKKFARTVGIAVDHRRRNKSYECVMKNKQRLQEYMNRLILLPKNNLKIFETRKEESNRAIQFKGPLQPVPIPKKHTKCMKLEIFKDAPSAYETLQVARRSVKKNKNKKKNTKFIDDDK